MPSFLKSTDSALQFRFLGTDRLYTDHEGRRVVVDVEGAGKMRLLEAEPTVLIVREDLPPELFSETFSDGSIVLAEGPGLVNLQVYKGSIPILEPEKCIWVDLPFQGAGWVVSGPEGFTVDDKREPAPEASLQFPVPFFRTVSGAGRAKIVVDESVSCRLVLQLAFDDPAALSAAKLKVQSMSAIFPLDSEFSNGSRYSAGVVSHLNTAEFSMEVPVDNDGLILRKIYDRFHGRQRARVMVDGKLAGWWYEPGEDRNRRWHVSDFGIPSELTTGKSSVRISIDPPAGVALWSVSLLQVFALQRA